MTPYPSPFSLFWRIPLGFLLLILWTLVQPLLAIETLILRAKRRRRQRKAHR